ncbi:MAG: cyclic nucleotide-binding domain-containing protein [Leptospiraceae bacterium]|nr:cyclic nucleotide-binding domain-containing protein [Leptospiraceae bacterium]
MDSIFSKLLENELFRDIDLNEKNIDISILNLYRFQVGEIVIEEGESSSELFLILDGMIEILQVTETGEEANLGIRKSGEFIGELGLIDASDRSCRVRSKSESTLLGIPGDKFFQLIQNFPKISLNLLRTLSQRQKNSDRLATKRYSELLEVNQNLEKLVEERTENLNLALKKIHKDLKFSEKLQSGILPPQKIIIESIHFFNLYQPLDEVGGDLFDIHQLEDKRIRVLLVDMTGHGIQAALLTMLIKSEYEGLKDLTIPPSEVFNLLNENIYTRYRSLNLIFPGFLVDIHMDKNEIIYSSAGHPEQFIIQNSSIGEMKKTGKIIGFLNDLNAEDRRI